MKCDSEGLVWGWGRGSWRNTVLVLERKGISQEQLGGRCPERWEQD